MNRNSQKLDSFRAMVPHHAARMAEGIQEALAQIRRAVRIADRMGGGDAQRSWRKGLTDSLLMLRDAAEAQENFRLMLIDAAGELEGITGEQKAALLAGFDRRAAGEPAMGGTDEGNASGAAEGPGAIG